MNCEVFQRGSIWLRWINLRQLPSLSLFRSEMTHNNSEDQLHTGVLLAIVLHALCENPDMVFSFHGFSNSAGVSPEGKYK